MIKKHRHVVCHVVTIRRIGCVILSHLALLVITPALFAANSAGLTLQISAETAPAGGWAQIKVFSAAPALVANGTIVMKLDPTVFGAIASPGVFGSKTDAYGDVVLSGLSLNARFSSPTGGIGQLAGVPIFVVSAQILPTASPGTKAAITLDAGASTWTDPTGSPYSVKVTPGSVTVGGSISISNVYPGGGPLPSGSVVAIAGTGLGTGTTVSIDGVVSSARYNASREAIEVTLGAPAELTGKRIVAKNPDGSQTQYFPFLSFAGPYHLPTTGFDGVHPLFPVQSWSIPVIAGIGSLDGVAIQNPNLAAVQVNLVTYANCCGPTFAPSNNVTVTLPPGTWGIYAGSDTGYADSTVVITASRPIQALRLGGCGSPTGQNVCQSAVIPGALGDGTIPLSAQPASISWNWQIGTPPPPPKSVLLNLGGGAFIATASTASGGAWLSVTPSEGGSDGPLTAIADPSGLPAGLYQGAITVTRGDRQSLVIPVSLTAGGSAPPQITASQSNLSFNWIYGSAAPPPQAIAIGSTGVPAAVSVFADDGDAGSWLQVTPTVGTTPATLSVSVDPTALGLGIFKGSIVVSGPENSITISVQVTVSGQVVLPASLIFSAQTGSAIQTRTVSLSPPAAPKVSVSIDNGSGWLTAMAGSAGTNSVSVSVNPAGLSPGIYTGDVSVTAPGAGPVQVPVTLGVWSVPPPLTVSPAALTFVAQVGDMASLRQTLSVRSAGVPLPLTISTPDSSLWLGATDPNAAPTPATIIVGANPGGLLPGQYTANITISAPGGTVTVPVTLLITTGPNVLPLIGAVANAASQTPGPVAPGEIVTIYGFGAGPPNTAGLMLDASGKVSTSLNNAQVLFDGIPAPLIYGSSSLLNAIVPYEVAGQTLTVVELVNNGTKSQAWGISVSPSAPGIFTTAGNGSGQAAVLNQDNSVNGASNPAPRGTVIQIFATGEGQTSPPGVTGSVTQSNANAPVLPVTVSIGGVNAPVQYQGAAPGAVAGLLQVDALIPQNVAPGPSIPISISIGGISSQSSATIAVQ